MSKIIHSLVLFLAVAVVILQFFTNAVAQDIEASISFDALSANLVRVEGRFTWPKDAKPARNLSFVQEYAGIKGLGERVSDVELKAADGSPVKYRQIQPGEYLADADFTSWAYTMDLTPLKDPSAAAHVSWVTVDEGILFSEDLLPKSSGSVHVVLNSKRFHNSQTRDERVGDSADFAYESKERSDGLVLDDGHASVSSIPDGPLWLTISGEWKFSSSTSYPKFVEMIAGGVAYDVAKDVFGNYCKTLGDVGAKRISVNLHHYPNPEPVGNYEADTRGRTITIISSDMPFESQSKQRLAEILRHEMFHLWFPNGVNLKGQYDWFYEGFAIYEAEKLGVAMGQTRFDDLLSTIERGLVIDRVQGRRQSLIDAGKNRFDGAGQYMYARGMLVAFLCDVAMLDASKGKLSVDDLLRDLYTKHKPPAPEADAEKTVLDALRSHKELQSIVDSYILGSGAIDPAPVMKAAGLEWTTGTTGLKVTAKPGGRQKTILDKLGYNNWRKLTQK